MRMKSLVLLVAAPLSFPAADLTDRATPSPNSTEPVAARFVPASVSWKGKQLLLGSTSDDGKPDADAVWSYLDGMRFEATDAFRELLETPTAKQFEITNPKDQAARNIRVDIGYGGRVDLWKLKVTRVPTKAGDPRCWTIDAEMTERFSELRWITRAWSRQLKKPR